MKKSRALAAIPIRVEPLPLQNTLDVAVQDALYEEVLPTAEQLKLLTLGREPVMVAWGAGRDSTAMIIELVNRSEPIDVVLFADTGSEKPETYAFVLLFMEWLRARGIPCFIVRYRPKWTRNWPYYETIEENCITNATLPSLAFGGPREHSCSQKWKIEPQNKWTQAWSMAIEAWAAGCKVVKLIGYDCSPQDMERYAEREGHIDPRYRYRYPLREWGWTLEDCIRCIERAGLPVPPKSACFICPSMKPWEVDALQKPLLRRIVLVEACADPFNTDIEGLWRNGTKGERGAIPKPGMITEYIREKGLLPSDEIDQIAALAPRLRIEKKDVRTPVPPEWRAMLIAIASGKFYVDHTPSLFTRASLAGVRPEHTAEQLSLLENA